MGVSFLAVIALAGATPLAPPPQPPVRYTVKAGDTLIAFAARWMTDARAWPAVQRANRIADPYRLPVGRVLTVPRELLKSEPLPAKVVAFRGDVRVNGRAVAMGSGVAEGAEILTGRDASVSVESGDGSRFSLPSNTRVRVARLRRVLLTGDLDRVFATAQGRGEWRAAPAPTPESRFMVTTPVSVSAVRGTEFRVGYEDAAVAGVTEGAVGVSGSNPDRAVALPKGKGVAVTAAGPGRTVDLLPAPELLQPGRTQAAPVLRFAVAPVTGSKSYVFEVGSDAGLIDRVAEVRDAGVSVELPPVPDGSWFVRATATDGQGIDGFAKTWAFERLSFGTRPPEAIGRGMRFRWLGGEGTREYRFTLCRDENCAVPVIDRAGLAEEMMTVTDLAPGTYWWRVTVTKFGGAAPVVASGDLQSFTVAASR